MVKTTKSAVQPAVKKTVAKKPEAKVAKKVTATAKVAAPAKKVVTKKTVAKKPVAKKTAPSKPAVIVKKEDVKKPATPKKTVVAKKPATKAIVAKKPAVKKSVAPKKAVKTKSSPAKKPVVKKAVPVAKTVAVAKTVEPLKKTTKKERNIFVCYANAFKRYFDFKGRTGRYGYWSFVGVNSVIAFILGALALCCVPYIDSVYSLLVFIPGVALSFRRLHDVNKSGWWFGLPLIGIFACAALALMPSVVSYDNPETFYEKHALYSLVYSIVALGSLGVLLYVFVLSFFKGTQGKNRFGDAPNV